MRSFAMCRSDTRPSFAAIPVPSAEVCDFPQDSGRMRQFPRAKNGTVTNRGTTMDFRIRGLEPAHFHSLFALGEAELIARGMRAMVIDEPNSAPCRIKLRDVEPGERVLLLQYAHQPANTPYRSGGPIFVSENASEPFDCINELPQMF